MRSWEPAGQGQRATSMQLLMVMGMAWSGRLIWSADAALRSSSLRAWARAFWASRWVKAFMAGLTRAIRERWDSNKSEAVKCLEWMEVVICLMEREVSGGIELRVSGREMRVKRTKWCEFGAEAQYKND